MNLKMWIESTKKVFVKYGGQYHPTYYYKDVNKLLQFAIELQNENEKLKNLCKPCVLHKKS